MNPDEITIRMLDKNDHDAGLLINSAYFYKKSHIEQVPTIILVAKHTIETCHNDIMFYMCDSFLPKYILRNKSFTTVLPILYRLISNNKAQNEN